MPQRLGLRSEIVFQLFLLMAASIIFIGVMLVNASEQELLKQRVAHNIALAELLFSQLATESLSTSDTELWLQNNLHRYRLEHGLQAVAVLGEGLSITASLDGELDGWPDSKEGEIVQLSRSSSTKLRYQGVIEKVFSSKRNYLLVSLPIPGKTGRAAYYQAYFSLDDIPAKIFASHRYLLPYILLVGMLLVLFGSYLLGKIVVRPIKGLQQASRDISSGNLDLSIKPAGPKEIYQLMENFNQMTRALQSSRQESEAHIESLEQMNRELEQTRNELVQSEKMASIGHLAAGIAHEIGNPLGALLGYLELLSSQQDPQLAKDIVDRSLTETRRIDQLVRDLLDYARPEEETPSDCNPGEVIEETIALLDQQESLPRDRLTLQQAETLPQVSISPRKLQQVLINLLLNARDASREEEKIDLRLDSDDRQVRISIRDHGEGIPAELRPHLFDPFFTTKPPGKGRGLGLFIAHRIISDAGGKIKVESVPDEGTSFTILLPTMESAADDA